MKPDPSVELFYDGVWNEVGDWRLNSGIDLSRGRADEAKRADPSKCALTLNNRHGNYSPRNPVSTLYGKIGRNTPLRVLEGSDIRFTGEVVAWPPRWDLSDSDVWVPIEAAGILRRLNQGQKPLRSPMFRDLSTRGVSVVAYWPMEEDDGATQFASGIGQGPATFAGPVDVGAYDEWPASEHVPTFDEAGAMLTALVPFYAGLAGQRLIFFLDVPTDGVASETPLIMAHTIGSIVAWKLLLQPDGGLRILAYSDVFGTIALNSLNAFAFNGTRSLVSLKLVQNGANIDWGVDTYRFDVNALGGAGATLNSHNHERFYGVTMETTGDGLNGSSIGHITIFNDTAANVNNTVWTTLKSSSRAWTGESAMARMIRLTDDESVPLVVVGDPVETELVGEQPIAELLDILSEAAEADLGFLGEDRESLSLLYRARHTLYNQVPALTLDYSDGEIFAPITPTDDDQLVRNQVTVKRRRGSSVTATLESGPLSVQPPPDGVGLYDTSIELSLASDAQLPNQAGWRLHLGTIDEQRVPVLTLNLANPRMEAHLAAIAAITEGDRIIVENTPAWLPPGGLDLIVQGWDEHLGEYEREITFNCTPGSAWVIGELDDDVLGKLDTAGSELASGIDDNDTGLSVATTSGPLWTTDAGEMPFDILIGGEVMTVTAISGAASPQTFTVTRGTNGIVKAHSSGAVVGLAHPARIGF